LLLCLTILLLPALVLGQAETTGRIAGNVIDENGDPVANARIEFVSEALLGTRVQTTDERGQFLASLLPVGLYTVTVAAPDRQSVTMSVQLKVGQTVPLDDIKLEKGEMMTEEVTVYSTATQMETTVLGENFNYDTSVEELPIQDRSIERVAEFAPNVSFGPTPNTLSIAGAPSFDTTVLLDGAEISDPYFGSAAPVFLEDAIEEVQVLTGGVSARYGRFQGGVVNAITKSGGNTFSGAVRAEFDKESWNSQTPFKELQSDDLNQLYQATVGGYIMKDHLWFYGGYRTAPTADISDTTIGSQDGYTSQSDETRWQLKLTGAINPSHVLALSHLDRDLERSNRAGLPAGDLFALAPREDPNETYTFTYQGVLSDTMFLDAMATDKEVSILSGGSTTTSSDFPEGRSPFLDFYGSNFAIYNNHWWDFNDASVRDNQTASVNMSNVLSAGDWGDHTLEYGLQYVDSETSGLNNQSPTGFNLLNYDVLLGGTQFANTADCEDGECTFNIAGLPPAGLTYRWQALDVGTLTQNVTSTAFYVQDSWQLRDWRFDVGLRYDQYELTADPFSNLDTDFDEISPRLGVTYNIDQNWQVQASWGKYVSRFNDNVASSVSGVGGAPYIVSIYTGPAQANLSYQEVEEILRDDANWGIITTITDPAQPIRFTADDITAPYANDFNLSLKHALPRNTGTFSVTFTDRSFRNLLDDFVGEEGFTTVEDPLGSGASFDFDLVRWDNASDANRHYQALTAAFDYRPGAKWDVGGNWTYAFTEGNYEGEGRNTPSSGSVIGDYPGSINEELAYPYGYLDEDVRHRINAWGAYRFDFDRAGQLTVGSTVLYQSAFNYSKTGGIPLEDEAEYLNEVGTTYTAFFGGRGNDRFNDWWALNASAKYQIPFYKDASAWLKLNVINLLDNDEVISWQTSGSADTSGAVPDWNPTGNFGSDECQSAPGLGCTGFGRIRNQDDYQDPRSFLVTLGVEF
jgi:outer membrane receptor protein involved in Fe transport